MCKTPKFVFFYSIEFQMASRICDRLINKVWHNYADLSDVPEAEGIYVIGKQDRDDVTYLYIGHSVNVHRRLQEHKHQSLEIDEFIKEQFDENGGARLRMKWVLQENSRRSEGEYLHCIERKLGYELRFNIRRGNGD